MANREQIAHEDHATVLEEMAAYFFTQITREDALRSYDAAAAGAEALRQQAQTWQPIETAPKDGTRILVARVTDGRVGISWWDGLRLEDKDKWACYSMLTPPTHWMPLPDPPAARQTGAHD